MARGSDIDIQLKGDRQLTKVLKEMPNRVAKKHQRRAVNAGATPIVRAAKAAAPRGTGLLRKALTKKVKTYPNGNAVAVIGANRSVVSETPNPDGGPGRKQVPARYIHLVEKGHGGPQPAPPHPFLEPASERTEAEAVAIVKAKMKEGILAEAEKMRAAG